MIFKDVYLHVEEVRGIFNYIFNFTPVNVSVEVLFLNPSMYRHLLLFPAVNHYDPDKNLKI